RAPDEELAQVRRAVRPVESASQPIARRDAPVDQRFVRLELIDQRHAPVRYAAAELDVEVLHTGRSAGHDWNQQLTVDLGDVEFSAAVGIRKRAGYRVGERVVLNQVIRHVLVAVLAMADTERITQWAGSHVD